MMNDSYKIVATERHYKLGDINVRLICPDCRRNPPNVVEHFAEGDLVCADCGLVIGDRIVDTRSEWRTFANEDDDPSRVGNAANPFLEHSQLDTIISRRDNGSGMARQLARAHGRASAHKGERFLMESYKNISAMCDHAGLSGAICNTAKQMYQRVHEENWPVNKDNDVVVAACIFIACRMEKVGRSFKEICALTKVNKTELGRAYKRLKAHMGDTLDATSSTELIARWCNRLRLSMEVERTAKAVSDKILELGNLAGRSPVSIAAACIYMVSAMCGDPRSAKSISVVCGASESTIKQAYKGLWNVRDQLLEAAHFKGEMEALPPA